MLHNSDLSSNLRSKNSIVESYSFTNGNALAPSKETYANILNSYLFNLSV